MHLLSKIPCLEALLPDLVLLSMELTSPLPEVHQTTTSYSQSLSENAHAQLLAECELHLYGYVSKC